MANQKQNGNAFEWAVANEIKSRTRALIEDSASSETNQYAHERAISEPLRKRQQSAAGKAVCFLLDRENVSPNSRGVIRFATDAMGQTGDVRDVVLQLSDDREIGISCKNNHSDLKHSRLSGQLDFVKAWGLDTSGCSDVYWKRVKPIFGKLRDIQNSYVPPPLWQTYAEKATEVYWPVLDAFAKELERVCGEGSPTAAENCKQLTRYLVGVRDFYKVIATPKKVSVQCFNMHGTLHGAKTPLPTAINSINNKNGGQ